MQKLKRVCISVTLALTIATQSVAVPAQAVSKVYIAPLSGTKYHCYRYCRGLSRASSVKKVSLRYAKSDGYTKCKLCY